MCARGWVRPKRHRREADSMTAASQLLTRRRFLGDTTRTALAASVAGAALAVPSRPAAAQEEWQPMSDRKIRMGVVGGGFGASFHWHQHPNCVVAAVSDLRTDRREHLMRVYQCETAYESLEKLILDDTLDAVAVFTGAPDHVRHCVAVMNAGKHCISAVPAAYTLEECEELVKTKQRTGLKYMMAETSYYRWPTITARNLHADGRFGELVYSEVEYYHPMSGAEREGLWFFNGQRTWRYGYPPMHYPTHSTGFLVGVTKERLVEVSCLGWTDPDEPALKDNVYGNPFSNAAALFKTDQGHTCRCNVMWRVHAGGERAQWFGTKLALYMPGSGGQPYVLQEEGRDSIAGEPDYWHMVPEGMRVDSGHGASHPFLTNEFVMALIEDREPAVDVYEALAMTAPGIVAHDSALRGGEQLKVPSYDPH